VTILFDLAKAVGMLAMPAGLLWILLLGVVILLARRSQWWPACLLALVWILYALAGNFYVGSALLAKLERTVPPVDLQRVEPFDAVFVLGGGSELDPAGGPMLGTSGDRILEAARLWHAGKARVLVASGAGHDAVGASRDLAQETRVLWRSLGVPEDAIAVVDGPCLNTRQEIAAYRRLKDQRGWKRTALVSSAWHLPRAMVLASKAGLGAVPVGSDWKGRAYPIQVQRLVPQGEGFVRTAYACWEHLGLWLGR
jgi:uncharacterized SAM-binding protein YcdF (DUF218 family)